MTKNGFQVESSKSNDPRLNPASWLRNPPPRATCECETNRNPEIFRNYFKTDDISRVSSKDRKDAKMRSSTFLTFDKPREFLKSSEPNGETNGRGISNVKISMSKKSGKRRRGNRGTSLIPES
jgi:hypothetical protein